MARILVTGSLGTLGVPLVQTLRSRGHEVWGCDLPHSPDPEYYRCDVRHYRELERVFEKKYHFVYHLAAEFGRLNGRDFYERLWETNVTGTRHILEFQKRDRFKLILASSSIIYGNKGNSILQEDLPLEEPMFPEDDYAISKWTTELLAMHFQKRYDAQIVRIRPFNVYGPGEYYHPYRSAVCIFAYHALHGLPYVVCRGYKRSYLYIDDCINTISGIADRFKTGEVYNIGGDDYYGVEDVSALILKSLGLSDKLVQYRSEDPDTVKIKQPDITKAIRHLDHNPSVSLEEGIPQTLAWMKKVYKDTIPQALPI